jgi:hypothetical protein
MKVEVRATDHLLNDRQQRVKACPRRGSGILMGRGLGGFVAAGASGVLLGF